MSRVDNIRTYVPRGLRRRVKSQIYSALDFAHRLKHNKSELPIPPLAMQTQAGSAEWERVGTAYLEMFKTLGDLKPEHSVYDIGCGNGRMAVRLTQYLKPEAQYYGFDVIPYGIDWCQRNISKRWSNFEFECFDLSNTSYNREGEKSPDNFDFPKAESSFDFAIATSIFTHLDWDTAKHYLQEISKVLKPNGTAFCTFYLLSEHSREQINTGRASFSFAHERDGRYVENPANPNDAVALDRDKLMESAKSCGLSAENIYPGAWSGGGTKVLAQDVVIFRNLQSRVF